VSLTHNQILQFAMSLPESERITLATELLDSLAGTAPGLAMNSPDFAIELDRRLHDTTPVVPWSEVQKLLDNDLKHD
jgi:hypothetical protein